MKRMRHSIGRVNVNYMQSCSTQGFPQRLLVQSRLPFANSFSDLAVKHDEELASGKAFVAGMGKGRNIFDSEKQLRPRKTGERSKTIGKNLASLQVSKKTVAGIDQTMLFSSNK